MSWKKNFLYTWRDVTLELWPAQTCDRWCWGHSWVSIVLTTIISGHVTLSTNIRSLWLPPFTKVYHPGIGHLHLKCYFIFDILTFNKNTFVFLKILWKIMSVSTLSRYIWRWFPFFILRRGFSSYFLFFFVKLINFFRIVFLVIKWINLTNA